MGAQAATMTTQDFWQSVLSGLSPATILEICGRSDEPYCVFPVPDAQQGDGFLAVPKSPGAVRTRPIPVYINSHTLRTEHFSKLSSKASTIVRPNCKSTSRTSFVKVYLF